MEKKVVVFNRNMSNNYSIVIRRSDMKGSIRLAVGFLMVFAAVGGMDNATDTQLFPLLILAGVGLAAMYSGVKAMKQ
jgi:hypothetical protein